MLRCPECDHLLPANREQLGARCPTCHDPLYEPPGRVGRPVRMGETACTVHEGTEALGPCLACGNPICEICRCAWQNEVICPACAALRLERMLEPNDPRRVTASQAGLSLLFGVLAWLLGASGVGLASVLGQATGPLALFLLFLTCTLIAFALGLAVSALGQGTAALLVRGPYNLQATLGVVLGGLFVGLLLGLFSLGAWLSS